MERDELLELLQNVYFDNIDNARPEKAVQALTENVCWEHNQVWEHDGHNSHKRDQINGRDSVFEFLNHRVPQMQKINIKHKVQQVILDGNKGAFRAQVVGPDGSVRPFMGWVELADGKVDRYLVVPENPGSAEEKG